MKAQCLIIKSIHTTGDLKVKKMIIVVSIHYINYISTKFTYIEIG